VKESSSHKGNRPFGIGVKIRFLANVSVRLCYGTAVIDGLSFGVAFLGHFLVRRDLAIANHPASHFPYRLGADWEFDEPETTRSSGFGGRRFTGAIYHRTALPPALRAGSLYEWRVNAAVGQSGAQLLLRRKRYHLAPGPALSPFCGCEDRLNVETVLGRFLLANAPDFINDGISRHDLFSHEFFRCADNRAFTALLTADRR
jgi:hypothetical protein